MTRPILAEYVHQGWVLVPFALGQKGPLSVGWQLRENCIDDPEVAAELDGNIGLAHAYSGTCAIDIDDMDASRRWLAGYDIDLDALWNSPTAVRLSSGRTNRGKLIYRMPTVLPSKKVVENKLNIIDFRCGNRSGTTVQDVLPPSIHPNTGKPYVWQYGDEDIGHWSALPEIPAELYALWERLVSTPAVVEGTVIPAGSHNMGKARALLFDNDPSCDRERWVEIGMALHHESSGGLDGLDLWNEWSARSEKYVGRHDLETVWRSFHYDVDSPITINSLRVDTAAEIEEFEPVVYDANDPVSTKPTPSALAEITNSLRRDKTGHALAILPNVTAVLSVPEISGQHIAYDSFTDLLVCANYGTNLWRPIKDTDYTATRLWLENTGHFYPVSKDLVRDTIYYIAEGNTVDTAQQWLASLVWDGMPRVRNFFPLYMGTIATEYEYACGEYIWSALAGRVMEPGCQADMVPILVGAQGIGKTRGIQAMSPDPKHYLEINLEDDDEKLARKMRGALIGEIAELRGLKNADLEQIKAFITRCHERWVPKYVEFATTYARRVVFIGTTNEEEFLADVENRRFLPLRISMVDVDAIKRDRDQLWAEALQMWMERGICWGKAQELAKENQDDYKIVDNWADLVAQWLAEHPDTPLLRTHDVMVQAIGLDIRHVTRTHELRVGRMLTELGYVRDTKRDKTGKNVRVWVKGVDKRKRRR